VSDASTSDGATSYDCNSTYTVTVPQTPIYIFSASDSVTNTAPNFMSDATMSLDQVKAKGGPALYVQNEFIA
jgi:hypothetical protein